MAISLPFGLIYFCLANVANSFISLFINTFYTGKLIGLSFKEQLMDLMPIFILSLASFSVAFGATKVFDNLWLQLLIGASLGVATYVGGAYSFRYDQIHDVKYMLNRKK